MTTFLEMIVYLLQVNNPLWPTEGWGGGMGGCFILCHHGLIRLILISLRKQMQHIYKFIF